MAVTNSFTGEIETISPELLKQLVRISAKAWRYKNTAEQLITLIQSIQPTIKEIQYGGVELPAHRQAQIRMFVENLEKGQKLTTKVLSSSQWNLYQQLTLAKKMENLKKTISGFLEADIFTNIVADVHHLRAEYNVRWSSSSSSSSSFTDSLMTPSMEFPDRISFRKMDLSEAGPSGTVAGRENTGSKSIKIGNFSNPQDMVLVTSWLKSQLLRQVSFGSVHEGISGDGDIFAVNDVSLLDQGSQTQECIQQLEAEIALLCQLQHQNIMSSSSSSVDSDSICSLITPSLEFPDRISFRKKDLKEAGPSSQDRIGFDIRGVEGEMDRIYRSLGVFGPDDLALDSKKRSSSDSHKVQAQHLSESGTSGVVEVSNTSPIYASGGSIITSWQKGQLLGRGSFSSVYEAISGDGDFFAVKEVSLLDQGSLAQEFIQQLEAEIELLSQLQHQNIVRYRGSTKDGSNLYIFLELVSQRSLLKLYQIYQLRDSVVSFYTRQILDGLKYLHDKGFIHRDIKCANILVESNGTVKLADFGLAKVSKFNDIKSCKGTPFWMAPEVINPPKHNDGYGSSADIWSLGCTVLEMCTGLIPYSNLEPFQALFRIGRGKLPEIPDTLSPDARDFILKCLKANPKERPTATELLNHPFVRRPLSPLGSGGQNLHFSVDEANFSRMRL